MLINSLQIISTILGILYVVFLIKEKYYAFICGFLSTLILIYIFFDAKIYLQAVLNLYYVVIAIYGFFTWRKKDKHNKYVLKIATLGYVKNLIMIIILLGIACAIEYLLLKYTNEAETISYLDSLIMVFSFYATFLQVRKYFENWLYWIVLNIMAVVLTLKAELYYTTILMIILTLMAVYGYIKWKVQLFIIKN